MSQKRTQDDSSNSTTKIGLDGLINSDDKRRKSLPSFRSVVLEVMKQQSFQSAFEPMLRRVVKEEVELAIRKYVMSLKRNSDEDIFSCELRNLQLKFLSTLSLPVFTGTRIEGEDGSAIKVALIDTDTQELVKNFPESGAKVEVVVLEGDFDGDEGENWTVDEFKNNVVREREGKKPLLSGDVHIYLKDGTGSVGEISFTDNSSWTRSRRFRLGARVIGNYDGAKIREAKTESFIVRDHRGELYKKHHPPSLCDEVWRLEKIGKDGAFHKRLSIERVRTVKDFLILLNLDPVRLRNVRISDLLSHFLSPVNFHSPIHIPLCISIEIICLFFGLFSDTWFRYVSQDVGGCHRTCTDMCTRQTSLLILFAYISAPKWGGLQRCWTSNGVLLGKSVRSNRQATCKRKD
ncbi:unnamed protein product [Amaranthus hypochondriacus]